MASYKQPCIHCGALIDRIANFCHVCGSANPFGYVCPTCRTPIEKGQRICSGCGRALYIECPHCGQSTFVQDHCEKCNESLMVLCKNRRCGQRQFFQNTKCTACGKKISKR